ncbi:uncharacterized protein LOC117607685 [Osmia lignaria lignaria]|uniref:uncharacterized protein LOC117607685 n=1 Tax=Osmia lignaria lignaria TaxID=1437193 RepID=UPI00402BB0D6
MFASSYFYAPTHPTVEDQVELARRISHSLSDVKNMKSKGQSMYVNRKKRSVKWIHDGNGVEDEEEPSTAVHRDKIPLKCMMNPHGKVLDIHGIQALGEEVNIEPMPKNPEKLFDIVRDLNNQKGRGNQNLISMNYSSAEIFAKRRKRSEKWVVDKDQPQTPTTPGTPKLNYSGKPFVVNVPGRNQYRCNGQECNHHSTEVKKIYLREVAVGTDNDFVDKSRSSIVEKSRRTAFEPDNEQYNNYRARNNGYDNTNKRNHNYNKASLSKCNFSNAHHHATNKEMKYVKEQRIAERVNSSMINDKSKLVNNQREIDSVRIDSDNSEYTPIPVKQLIQEFEKTCRPVLQYKQISPKVIPIIQHSPIDNDIARFFETRNSVKPNTVEEHRRITNQRAYDESVRFRDNCNNVYISTDDTEYTSDESDSQTNDYASEDIIYREKSETSSLMNGDQEYSSMYREECSSRRRSITSEEVENFCNNGDGKFTNTETDVPVEAKSLLLSMIASQEDILETIKHLRSTPVLDNLLHGVSPDCKFGDICPDGGKKLYEDNNTYTGPKLASVHNLTNYNTAPRGWDQSLTFYRPIKFEKPQEIVYSDF